MELRRNDSRLMELRYALAYAGKVDETGNAAIPLDELGSWETTTDD